MEQYDHIPSLAAAAEQNRRLQQIIAELLHKNEALRQQLAARSAEDDSLPHRGLRITCTAAAE